VIVRRRNGDGANALLPHRLSGPAVPARVIDRTNRFLARCRRDDGSEVMAHVPDRGRLEGVLVPGARAWLYPAATEGRSTSCSLLVCEEPATGTLVAIDPAGANRHVRALLGMGLIPGLETTSDVRSEVRHGASRFDFRVVDERGPVLVEVKSVGAARGGVGLFPDAPTERGARHVRELADIARSGEARALVLFVAQRGDVERVRAYAEIDQAFARAMQEARDFVAFRAVGFDVTPDGCVYRGEVPVDVERSFS
jgi:sugar fermentation stimulation protein A